MRTSVIHISLLFGAGLLLASPLSAQRTDSLMQEGYQLVWQDEFDKDGKPDPKTGLTNKALSAIRNFNGISRRMPKYVMVYWSSLARKKK